MLYFDHNATTPPSRDVVRAMTEALEVQWANPSSLHRAGQAARRIIDQSRKHVAALVGARTNEIVFTGSGTESIGLAIRGVLAAAPGKALVTDALEHSAVRQLASRLECEGVPVHRLPVVAPGVVDPEPLATLLATGRVGLVSVQWANNETGLIQPIERIAELCCAAGVLLHCDATQWVGKMPMPEGPPCDLLTCSPHKFHGPKGVGVLWIRKGIRPLPQVLGAQERGLRGGTENVAGIAGAGVAAAEAERWLADPALRHHQALVRDRFESAVLERCPGTIAHGRCGGTRVWNTANIAFPRLEADALLLMMSERGLCASAGSACSSGSIEPSAVLRAMGVPDDLAHGSVRFSIGRTTTPEEADAAAAIVHECAAKLR